LKLTGRKRIEEGIDEQIREAKSVLYPWNGSGGSTAAAYLERVFSVLHREDSGRIWRKRTKNF